MDEDAEFRVAPPGDVAHVRVVSDPAPNCPCGRRGCLETVAAGGAIRAELARHGVGTESIRELVELGLAAHPDVSVAFRTAGDRLGRALASLVNFVNPTVVVIGGALSAVDAFVASTRSALYEHCLPMCTQDLVIDVALTGADAAVQGLAQLARPLALPPTRGRFATTGGADV